MPHSEEYDRKMHHELSTQHHDPLIRILHQIIRFCVKLLAILMVIVIFMGTLDVCYVLYTSIMSPPFLLISVGDMFKTFGAFMVVLIAVEIFINIRLYLGSNTLPIKLVIGTALMAIARKVIVLDLDKISSNYIFAIGAVVIALGVAYWLVGKTSKIMASTTGDDVTSVTD